jgi:hypothetical protein
MNDKFVRFFLDKKTDEKNQETANAIFPRKIIQNMKIGILAQLL